MHSMFQTMRRLQDVTVRSLRYPNVKYLSSVQQIPLQLVSSEATVSIHNARSAKHLHYHRKCSRCQKNTCCLTQCSCLMMFCFSCSDPLSASLRCAALTIHQKIVRVVQPHVHAAHGNAANATSQRASDAHSNRMRAAHATKRNHTNRKQRIATCH